MTPPMLIVAWPTSQVGDAGGDDAAERVGRPAGDPQAGVGEDAEQREHDEAADDAELLGDQREDEVVVRVGQPAPLEVALAEPDAEPAAVGDRVPALQRLVARIVRRRSRCSAPASGRKPVEPLRPGSSATSTSGTIAGHADRELSQPNTRSRHPGGVHQADEQDDHADHRAEVVVADQEQHQHGAGNRVPAMSRKRFSVLPSLRQHARRPTAPARAWPARTAASAPGRGRATGRRRGPGRSRGAPSAPVLTRPSARSWSATQQQRDDHQRPGHGPVGAHRQPLGEPERDQADQRVDGLPGHRGVRVAAGHVRLDAGRREDHHQTDHQQQAGARKQQVVRRERPGEQAAQRGEGSCAAASDSTRSEAERPVARRSDRSMPVGPAGPDGDDRAARRSLDVHSAPPRSGRRGRGHRAGDRSR